MTAIVALVVVAAASNWYLLADIEGTYNTGVLHCLCDAEQYVIVEDGKGTLVRYHPDRTEELIFTYTRTGITTYELTFTHADLRPINPVTVQSRGIGIVPTDQRVYQRLGLSTGSLEMLFPSYALFGN